MIEIVRTMNHNALQEVQPIKALLFEGESNAHKIIIQPTGGVSFTGHTVEARFVRPDESQVTINGSLVDGNAVVTLPGGCYIKAGRFKVSIFVKKAADNISVCVYSAYGTIQPTTGNGTVGSTTVTVETSDQRISALEARVTALENS
jgi:hypothetical protein